MLQSIPGSSGRLCLTLELFRVEMALASAAAPQELPYTHTVQGERETRRKRCGQPKMHIAAYRRRNVIPLLGSYFHQLDFTEGKYA
jgi:hypothetical protein